MRDPLKLTLVALAAGLAGVAATAPSLAQTAVRVAPQAIPYSDYQDPHGHYESLADFTRSINGIPCGIACTREAQARWSHASMR